MEESGELVRTALYDAHVEAGGHIVDFHGFELPIWYSSMMEEHHATRKAAGLFDVSHMGFFRFSGDGLLEWFEGLATQSVVGISAGRCAYTHFLDEEGRIIDDMIFSVTDREQILATGCTDWANPSDVAILGVPNASMVGTMSDWFSAHLPADGSITLENLSDETSILALQGPASPAVLEAVLGPENVVGRFKGQAICENSLGISGWIQGTGYTGERGFEIFVSNGQVRSLWDALLADEGGHGIVPVGLGARDTLRLEKGYLLSGQDFLWPLLGEAVDDSDDDPMGDSTDDSTDDSPDDSRGDSTDDSTDDQTSYAVAPSFLARDSWETNVPFGLDLDHDFIGKERVMASQAAAGARWWGVRYLERGPLPRTGSKVLNSAGEHIGIITSGGPSPSLGNVGIGIGYLDGVAPGDEVLIAPNPRKQVKAEVVRTPFF
jgi:aminomethyltransferase